MEDFDDGKVLYKEESYAIVGAAYKVFNELRNGFLESVYQEAFEIMLQEAGIPYEREKELPIYFRGKILNKKFRVDFLCYDNIIVELKAVDKIIPEHRAQLINYLSASKFKLGILINFGSRRLEHERVVRLYD